MGFLTILDFEIGIAYIYPVLLETISGDLEEYIIDNYPQHNTTNCEWMLSQKIIQG
jgi:hypothetical protein